MTIGIYALLFDNYVYIGQSINISRRIEEHNTKFFTNTASTKVQNAFNTYGIPEVYILQECSKLELDYYEKLWIKEFDSFNGEYGLNSTLGGSSSGVGTDNINSVYTKDQLIEVLRLLVQYPYLSYEDISNSTQVSKFTIQDIVLERKHSDLREYAPSYMLALDAVRADRIRTARCRTNKYPTIKSPDGTEYNIYITVQTLLDNIT